jgi:uncharacterized repeat protein (TIGR01451 family)
VKRFTFVAAALAVVAGTGVASSPTLAASSTARCNIVSKTVHGKKVRVRVCARAPKRADLAVTVASPSTDSPTYTVTVSNLGPYAASGVTLVDDVPSALEFVRGTGVSCAGTTRVTCSLARLPATVSLVMQANNAGLVTNSVSVSGTSLDPSPRNNRASASSTVALRFVPVGSYKAQLAAATSLPDAQTALRSLGANYGVSIDVVAPAPASYYATFDTLTASDLDALKAYGAVFIDEWAKYPPAFIAWSRLRTIKLVRNLSVSGIAKTAAPTPFDSAMIYDITAGTNEYAKTVIHHEFDHFFTFEEFGAYAPSDAGWVALNPAGFQYGNGGTACYVTPGSCLSGPHVVENSSAGTRPRRSRRTRQRPSATSWTTRSTTR